MGKIDVDNDDHNDPIDFKVIVSPSGTCGEIFVIFTDPQFDEYELKAFDWKSTINKKDDVDKLTIRLFCLPKKYKMGN